MPFGILQAKRCGRQWSANLPPPALTPGKAIAVLRQLMASCRSPCFLSIRALINMYIGCSRTWHTSHGHERQQTKTGSEYSLNPVNAVTFPTNDIFKCLLKTHLFTQPIIVESNPNMSVHHYECVALCFVNILQRARS